MCHLRLRDCLCKSLYNREFSLDIFFKKKLCSSTRCKDHTQHMWLLGIIQSSCYQLDRLNSKLPSHDPLPTSWHGSHSLPVAVTQKWNIYIYLSSTYLAFFLAFFIFFSIFRQISSLLRMQNISRTESVPLEEESQHKVAEFAEAEVSNIKVPKTDRRPLMSAKGQSTYMASKNPSCLVCGQTNNSVPAFPHNRTSFSATQDVLEKEEQMHMVWTDQQGH